jgi:hypothetical protein
MTSSWRGHPMTRVIAGILGVSLIAGAIIALIAGVANVRARNWSAAAISIVAIPALVLARLFLIGAWTGEEPAVAFEPSDSDSPSP